MEKAPDQTVVLDDGRTAYLYVYPTSVAAFSREPESFSTHPDDGFIGYLGNPPEGSGATESVMHNVVDGYKDTNLSEVIAALAEKHGLRLQ